MATPGPEVAVRFVADTTGFQQGAGEVSGGLDRMKGAAGALATGLAGLQVGQFIGDAVKSASNLNEAASKVDTVFGTSASTIQDWSKTTASSMGISQSSALDAAGAFGNMLTQVGLTSGEAANMSTGMVQLASDFASFNNADPTQVLEAQQAAFRGEYDALQRFVPTINAAAVEQRAMADTGKTNADQLTASEKAMATYSLMVEGAGAAQGDFARTSDEAANSQRTANAQWEDAQAALGQQLLPLFTDLMGVLSGVLPILTRLAPVIMPLVAAFAAWAAITSVLTTVQTAFGISLGISVGWIALIVVAIAGIAAAFIWAYNNVDWFRTGVQAMVSAAVTAFNFLWGIIQAVFNWIASNWQLLLTILTGPIGLAVSLIITHWETIKAAATALFAFVSGVFSAIASFIVSVFSGIVSAASALWSAVTGFFRALGDFIAGVFVGMVRGAMSAISGAFDILKSAAQAAADWVKQQFGNVVSFFADIPGKIGSALSGVYNAIISPFKQALDWLSDIPGKIKGIIDSIPGAGAIGNVLGGLNPFGAPAPGPAVPTGLFASGAGVGARALLPAGTAMTSLAGASRGRHRGGLFGNVTYQIQVEVAPNHNPAEVGRNVVDAIRAFESAAGTGWRA